jgi:predicted ATPase
MEDPEGKDSDRFVILTGGMACGKTTLVNALERAGFAGSLEAGRGIIEDQVTIGGPVVPWQDPSIFAEMMLSWEMRSYHAARKRTGIVFFDRGVPDVLGYYRVMGLPVPKHVVKAVAEFRYNHRVFIAPPWHEIFEGDRTRTHSFGKTMRTYEAMIETYTECGYELIELPRLTVDQRVRFVIDNMVTGRSKISTKADLSSANGDPRSVAASR